MGGSTRNCTGILYIEVGLHCMCAADHGPEPTFRLPGNGFSPIYPSQGFRTQWESAETDRHREGKTQVYRRCRGQDFCWMLCFNPKQQYQIKKKKIRQNIGNIREQESLNWTMPSYVNSDLNRLVGQCMRLVTGKQTAVPAPAWVIR